LPVFLPRRVVRLVHHSHVGPTIDPQPYLVALPGNQVWDAPVSLSTGVRWGLTIRFWSPATPATKRFTHRLAARL